MKKLKNLVMKILGITELKLQFAQLKSSNKAIIERHRKLESICDSIMQDNRVILNHVKMINEDFSAVADINVSNSRYEPSVVIVMRKYQGQQDVVKTYNFSDGTMEHIFRFLEGFGKENVRIDVGPSFRFKKPNFLY
jgi:hypothetical protein